MNGLKYFLMLIAFLSLLEGCAEVKDAMDYANIGRVKSRPTKVYVFECADDFSFTVSIDDDSTAWLFLPGQTLKLPHVFSVSGAKFSADKTTLWTKGEKVRLEIGGVSYSSCKNNRARAIWENAKLNGVDFRAIGNEPSWVLEVIKDETIIFGYFFDEVKKDMFKQPQVFLDQVTGKTLYKAKNKEHTLLVTITGEACQDSMSGEHFSSSVSVLLDGKTFKGCGRALH